MGYISPLEQIQKIKDRLLGGGRNPRYTQRIVEPEVDKTQPQGPWAKVRNMVDQVLPDVKGPAIRAAEDSVQSMNRFGLNAWNMIKQQADRMGDYTTSSKARITNATAPVRKIMSEIQVPLGQMATSLPWTSALQLNQGVRNYSPTIGNIFQTIKSNDVDFAKDMRSAYKAGERFSKGEISKNEYINTATPLYMNHVANMGLTGPVSKGSSALSGLVKGSAKKVADSELKNLLTYTGELKKLGFSDRQISKISADEAKTIISQNLPGFMHDSFESVGNVLGRRKPPTTLSVGPTGRYEAGLKGGSFTGEIDDTVKSKYADWVNQRNASKIEGVAKRPQFSDLDNEGLEGVFKFQSGDKTGSYGKVKEYFDNKYGQLEKEGIKFGYKQDYLPQLWENSPAEVQAKLGKRLGLKPSFTIDSVIENYKEGIEKGLTPRFKKVSDLVVWYEQRANKAIADRNFFNYLADESLIQPQNQAPDGWTSLDADRFPNVRVKIPGVGEYVGNFKAPEPVAKLINNYLKQPEGNLQQIADVVSGIKNRVFSAGVPNTGWNFHGINVLARNTLARKNPFVGFLEGAKYLTIPSTANKVVMNQLDNAAYATRHGLKLGVEDFAFKMADKDVATTAVGKLEKTRGAWFEKMFSDPLFQKAIPAMKLQHFNEIYDDLAKKLPKDQAAKKAAEVTNSIYGGLNIEQIGRSRETQNLFRAFAFAPDWMETQFKLGKGIAQSLKNPTSPIGKAYRTFARNLVMAYGMANVMNKVSTGKYMWENDPGHTFEIELGSTPDGKTRYLRPFGTAVDFLRIPLDAALGLAKGDPTPTFRAIRNRLSTPAGTAVGLMTNTDYRGRPIYGSDKYGNELGVAKSAGGVASEVSKNVLPTQISAFIDFVTGRSNLEEAGSQVFELPLRYQSVAFSPTQQMAAKELKDSGLSGSEIKKYFDESRAIDQQSETTRENAEKLLKKIRTLKTKEERTNAILELEEQGQLTNEFFDALDKQVKKKTIEEKGSNFAKALNGLRSNAARANFIVASMKNKTPEQKGEMLTELNDLGILSNDLLEEMYARLTMSSAGL